MPWPPGGLVYKLRVDVDGYIEARQHEWARLATLTRSTRRSVRRLGPGELDELIRLYQRVSAHLSHARATYDNAGLNGRLTRLVADANAVIYGKRARTIRAVVTFVADTFPAAVWRSRRFVLVAALLTLAPAVATGTWLAVSDRAVEASAPEAVREAYLEEDFESYYSSEPAAQFATEVTVNNIRVSILAFALGIAGCVGTAYVLIYNGASVGFAAGLFHAAGEAPRFWGLILPHGLLELSAVIIAGGAGLRMGWAIIAPGDRSRTEALAEEGRRSVVIIIGLIAAFVVAGLIEGFVTGSDLSTPIRVGIGLAVEAAFIVYLVTQGRAAVARGVTGLVGDTRPHWADEVAPATT
jgi:uncharacterized membrane protein SpoIIM required for sporulation